MTDVTTTPTTNVPQDANQTPKEDTGKPQVEGQSFDVPRPFLSLTEAAHILGKSLRSIERSITGRWGNKLPEGWSARKIRSSQGVEWKILPPPGFKVRFNSTGSDTTQSSVDMSPASGEPQMPWRPERHTIDQPTIVIDRSEEVEHLLRELVAAKSALAEERRLHLEDLRVIHQLQGSVRLLEVNANEQARTKAQLEETKQELSAWKEKYAHLLSLPWWKKLFKSSG